MTAANLAREHAAAAAAVGAGAQHVPGGGLCRYTRARCYSSLKFLVTIGVLYLNEIGKGQCRNALVEAGRAALELLLGLRHDGDPPPRHRRVELRRQQRVARVAPALRGGQREVPYDAFGLIWFQKYTIFVPACGAPGRTTRRAGPPRSSPRTAAGRPPSRQSWSPRRSAGWWRRRSAAGAAGPRGWCARRSLREERGKHLITYALPYKPPYKPPDE